MTLPVTFLSELPVEPLAITIEESHLDRHPVAVYLAHLAPGSRRTMRTALRTIAQMVNPDATEMSFPWATLDYAHTAAIRAKLSEKFAPNTANKILAALRGVLKMSFRLGLMTAEQMTRATDLDPVRGSRVPKGRCISPGELRALFQACSSTTPIGARDSALLGILFAAGLRRAEVVSLDLEHFDPTAGSFIVKGKGNKERKVYVTNGALEAVTAWVLVRGSESGPLLYPIRKGNKIENRRMSDAGVAERIHYLAAKAGVSAFAPHDFRRSFVSEMLDAGADIAVVQQMAGHSSPATTSRYDRRGERAKQKAAGLLHVPYCKG
jgi:site-specific recombinase XerD